VEDCEDIRREAGVIERWRRAAPYRSQLRMFMRTTLQPAQPELVFRAADNRTAQLEEPSSHAGGWPWDKTRDRRPAASDRA